MKAKNDLKRRLYVRHIEYERDWDVLVDNFDATPQTHPEAFYEVSTQPHIPQSPKRLKNAPLKRYSKRKLKRRLRSVLHGSKLKTTLTALWKLDFRRDTFTSGPLAEYSRNVARKILNHYQPPIILLDEAWFLMNSSEAVEQISKMFHSFRKIGGSLEMSNV